MLVMSSYCELIYIYNFIIWILTYFVGQGWCAWLLYPKFTSLIRRQGGRFSCAMKIDWCSILWKGVKVSWPSVINLWLLRFLHTLSRCCIRQNLLGLFLPAESPPQLDLQLLFRHLSIKVVCQILFSWWHFFGIAFYWN